MFKTTSKPFLAFFLLLSISSLFFSFTHAASGVTCGQVFDGSTPLVDIDRQADRTQLRANWVGFDGTGLAPFGTTGTTGSSSSTGGSVPVAFGSAVFGGSSTGGSTGTTGYNSPVVYQIAIISEKQATKAINASGADVSSTAQRCRSSPGFSGVADILPFTTVVPAVYVANGFVDNVFKSGNLKNLVKGQRYYIILKATSRNGNSQSVYSNSNGVVVGEGSGSNQSDDDDDFPAYKAGLIAMGIAIFCLLCLLLLIILLVVVLGNKGDDKYATTVHRNENVEKE